MGSHAATEDKRAAILRAATKTIAEDGIGASTASVAKAAAWRRDRCSGTNYAQFLLSIDLGRSLET